MTGPVGHLDLPAPTTDRWSEDYVPGSVFELGHTRLSEQEIMAFAHDYDPTSSTPTPQSRRPARSAA